MTKRQRVLLSKDIVDLVGDRSRETGESISCILEDLIINENKTKWLKESDSEEDTKREFGVT
tara:strand:- start:17 stop:202 length:186 start_codon:yes stop_codon:yes gene_type:complete